jgi:hypothetical protein
VFVCRYTRFFVTSFPYSINSNSRRPIHTYGGKGTLASHAKASQHVQVYTESEPPPLLHRERLSRDPVKVVPKSSKIVLDKASRLSLIKPASIEHNLPVAEIGKVGSRDLERIRGYTLEYLGKAEQGDDDEEEKEEGKGVRGKRKQNKNRIDEESEDDEEEDEERDQVPDIVKPAKKSHRSRNVTYLEPRQSRGGPPIEDLPERSQSMMEFRSPRGRRTKWL